MISVNEARDIISANVQPLPAQRVTVPSALGLVLAEPAIAAVTVPGFAQSSMDGYAFSFDNWQSNNQLRVTQTIAAGAGGNNPLHPGEAARIFTGAPVPVGADTVVMQEKTRVADGHLIIDDPKLTKHANVRPANGEISAGDTALPGQSIVTAPAIGFLTAIGVTHVQVYPRPAVTIIVTGDELQQSGTTLQSGKVYESNAAALTAALSQLQISNLRIMHAADEPSQVTRVLENALNHSDLVLITGGISVGDYDFVLQATIKNKVKQLFHQVKQRPGKPLYFGMKGTTCVFGLPGNPSSTLTAFYEYAAPALGLLCGRNFSLTAVSAPLVAAMSKPAGLTVFLKGHYHGGQVEVLDAQESYRMRSFARANCLVQVNEGLTDCAAGDLVEIHMLPQ